MLNWFKNLSFIFGTFLVFFIILNTFGVNDAITIAALLTIALSDLYLGRTNG